MRSAIREIWEVSQGKEVHVSDEDLTRLSAGREAYLEAVEREGTVYGFNTGLGKLAKVKLSEDSLVDFQYYTLRSHATSVGPPLPVPYVRAAMYVRVKHLMKGVSGVRPEVVSRMVEFLNLGITPKVPERGSVGASGDLSPNAHIGLALIGEGWVYLRDGREVPSIVAHRMYGLEPLELVPREALAVINGYTFSLAILSLNLHRLDKLLHLYDSVFPMVWYTLRGRKSPLDPEAVAVMGDRYAVDVARRVWKRIRDLPEGNRVQDPYSVRTYPQVMGAVLRAYDWVQKGVAELLEGVSDNPVLVEGRVMSTGNFHGQTVALLADTLSAAITTAIGMADRRIHFALSPESGLPEMLAREPGTDSGLMMLQVAVSSIFADAKVLSTPYSFQSSPTSAGQEDWVPMSFSASLRLGKLVNLLAEVLAAELLMAYRAFELTGDVPETLSYHYGEIKKRMPQYRRNLSLSEEWNVVLGYVLDVVGRV